MICFGIGYNLESRIEWLPKETYFCFPGFWFFPYLISYFVVCFYILGPYHTKGRHAESGQWVRYPIAGSCNGGSLTCPGRLELASSRGRRLELRPPRRRAPWSSLSRSPPPCRDEAPSASSPRCLSHVAGGSFPAAACPPCVAQPSLCRPSPCGCNHARQLASELA